MLFLLYNKYYRLIDVNRGFTGLKINDRRKIDHQEYHFDCNKIKT